MAVTIGEVVIIIDILPEGGAREELGAGALAEAAFEVRLEDLRSLVRALVAEELERRLRQRSDCP